MNLKYFFHQVLFLLRYRYIKYSTGNFRKIWLKAFGMRIGKGTLIPGIKINWPHQVAIGNHCQLEPDIFFKYDGIWEQGPSIIIGNDTFIGSSVEFNIKRKIIIGDHSLIASGAKFIDHDHGTVLGELMNKQQCPEQAIIIGTDVWIGCNVVVLKGVIIGDGAIVAAGAIVTKSILQNEIWAGIPAKKIGIRGRNK